METINVRISEKQIQELDRTVAKLNYSSRSEFIREALRNMIEDHLDLSAETVEAISLARKQENISHSDVKKKLGL